MASNEFERPDDTGAPTETHAEPAKDGHAAGPGGGHPDRHASDAMTGPHGSMADHGADHGHDDHGHDAEAIGPVNLQAWAAGIGGLAIGLAIVLVMARAAGAL